MRNLKNSQAKDSSICNHCTVRLYVLFLVLTASPIRQCVGAVDTIPPLLRFLLASAVSLVPGGVVHTRITAVLHRLSRISYYVSRASGHFPVLRSHVVDLGSARVSHVGRACRQYPQVDFMCISPLRGTRARQATFLFWCFVVFCYTVYT